MHQVFKKAKQSAPCLLFFDEIDALVPARSIVSNQGAAERVSSQFFNELDNLSDHSQVIVLGATNREDLLDPALMRAGRLDCVLQFPIPDEKERFEIFQVHTRERPLGGDVNLTELAALTDGLTGSEIASVCRNSTMMAISEFINSAERKPPTELLISSKHFLEVIKAIRKTQESLTC